MWKFRAKKWVDKAQRTTHQVERVLETLFYAREGTVVEKTVAGVSVATMLLQSSGILSFGDKESNLKKDGWVQKEGGVYGCQDFLTRVLNESGLTREDFYLEAEPDDGDEPDFQVWSTVSGQQVVALCTPSEPWQNQSVWEKFPGIIDEVIQQAWPAGHATIKLSVRDSFSSARYRSDDKVISLTPLGTSNIYIGGKDQQRVINSFRRGDDSKVVLLVGPTGVGKTTLACHALGNDVKVTIINLESYGENQPIYASILKILSPDVILVDDIPLSDGFDRRMARAFDSLHEHANLVVCTFMEDELVDKEQIEPGCFYVPGMRPGRIDEIVYLLPPDEDTRREILIAYGLDQETAVYIAAQTEKLTGAYLKEISRRVNEGWSPSEAIQSIRHQAPPSMSSV